jgi:hypothetical protein
MSTTKANIGTTYFDPVQLYQGPPSRIHLLPVDLKRTIDDPLMLLVEDHDAVDSQNCPPLQRAPMIMEYSLKKHLIGKHGCDLVRTIGNGGVPIHNKDAMKIQNLC